MAVVRDSDLKDKKKVWCDRLQSIGAFWEYRGGEFVAELTLTKKVADFYFNSNVPLSEPSLIKELCQDVFVSELILRSIRPSFILTVAPFGLPLASILAAEMKVAIGYIAARERGTFSRAPKDHDQSIVVTDDIWSGDSVATMLELLRRLGRKMPAVILAIANCSDKTHIEGIPICSIFQRKVNVWPFEQSPYAKMEGIKPISAREHWDRLVPIAF